MTAAVDQRRRARTAPLRGPFTPEQENRVREIVREEATARTVEYLDHLRSPEAAERGFSQELLVEFGAQAILEPGPDLTRSPNVAGVRGEHT